MHAQAGAPRAWALAVGALLAALALFPSTSHAVGLLSGAGHIAVEQRVALAVGPDRSTLWASLRLDGNSGPVAMVVPAAPGAAIDWSSPAWLEALEVATAPRILPPSGVNATCPGDPPGDPFHVAGDVGHVAPLFPVEVAVLADGAAVATWAAQNNLSVAPALATALQAFPGQRFVAARFNAPAGPALTPTLRVVGPAVTAELPFVLTRAGAGDLLLTTFLLGAGRGQIDGAAAAQVSAGDLDFDAATATSDYLTERDAALASAGAGAALVEAASHDSLVVDVPIADGTGSIDGVVTTYFERAATYGDGLPGFAACAALAASALSGAAPVASSCPRADLGVVDGTDTCVETVGAGETDPAKLRCGNGADDLAVALAGLSPAGAWLTRVTQIVPAQGGGAIEPVSFPGGAAVSPLLTANSLDLGGCGATTAASTSIASGSTTTSGNGTGPGATSGGQGGATVVLVPVYSRGPSCSCDGTYTIVDYVETNDGQGGSGGDPPAAYYQDEDCEGDTSGAYETEPADDGGCGSDTSDTAETADDSGGCSGETSDTTDEGTTGDSSTSDSSTTGDSGGGGETGASDCAVIRPRSPPRSRFSILLLGALAFVAPLRRALRRRPA